MPLGSFLTSPFRSCSTSPEDEARCTTHLKRPSIIQRPGTLCRVVASIRPQITLPPIKIAPVGGYLEDQFPLEGTSCQLQPLKKPLLQIHYHCWILAFSHEPHVKCINPLCPKKCAFYRRQPKTCSFYGRIRAPTQIDNPVDPFPGSPKGKKPSQHPRLDRADEAQV